MNNNEINRMQTKLHINIILFNENNNNIVISNIIRKAKLTSWLFRLYLV